MTREYSPTSDDSQAARILKSLYRDVQDLKAGDRSDHDVAQNLRSVEHTVACSAFEVSIERYDASVGTTDYDELKADHDPLASWDVAADAVITDALLEWAARQTQPGPAREHAELFVFGDEHDAGHDPADTALGNRRFAVPVSDFIGRFVNDGSYRGHVSTVLPANSSYDGADLAELAVTTRNEADALLLADLVRDDGTYYTKHSREIVVVDVQIAFGASDITFAAGGTTTQQFHRLPGLRLTPEAYLPETPATGAFGRGSGDPDDDPLREDLAERLDDAPIADWGVDDATVYYTVYADSTRFVGESLSEFGLVDDDGELLTYVLFDQPVEKTALETLSVAIDVTFDRPD